MLEKYYKYKVNYNDYIIIIKVGNFYEVIDKDSLIINKLLNYKIKKISNTFKVGFPVNSLGNVLNVLNNNYINYVVINNDSVDVIKEFDNNGYYSYNMDVNIVNYNMLRIDRINKYLCDLVVDSKINNLLSDIEVIINEG